MNKQNKIAIAGISNSGVATEEMFLLLIKSTKLRRRDSRGDALFEYKGKQYFIEIKKCGISKNGQQCLTINQVRPNKYTILAIYAELEEQWYIVPANAQIQLANKQKRGQHTISPFESCTLSLADLQQYRVKHTRMIKQAIIDVIKEDDMTKNIMLKQLMNEHQERIKQIVEDTRQKLIFET